MVRLPLVAVLVAILLLWGHEGWDPAQAQGPGMSLDAPTTVSTGETFTVVVMADHAPDVEITAFATEVLFPGLEWLQRDSCEDEVQVERRDGGALAACISFIDEVLGGAATAVLAEFAQPPVEPLALAPGSTAPLVELDFRCTVAGSYTLTLVATPDVQLGAIYGDTDGDEISVETKQYDYDGDTTPNDVADSVTISCEGPTVPTLRTPRPTGSATEQAGETPGEIEPTATSASGNNGNGNGDGDGVGDGDGDSGLGRGLWAVIAAIVAVAVAGLAVFGWRYMRSR